MFRIVPQLIVTDMPASMEFYTRRLGFEATLLDPPDAPHFVSLEREDATLFLITESAVERPSLAADLAENRKGIGVRLYIEVDDAQALYDKLKVELAGVLGELKYNEKEDYTEFTVRDPDGYEIGIYS